MWLNNCNSNTNNNNNNNKSETGSESKVTILWNQQPKTDSSIQNYKSYIIKSKVSPLEVYVA